ncbi:MULTISPECIES: hypothetical protein [unclassified Paenibacillus]|uniref:hypothetical protein n=1 Tax=unclassified Paenibacillus TaxID=185978 RepID=UPI001AE94227|nr:MULTISPECIES: hypothetical protein [unclassified Paenibacillus]MBP1157111.1 TM2 domain-containing membrane protein YozV [Paenibacillus sp. PvP091]MBP1172150.1 TM2 domain-containing membrane protein YozV [Paenibacillus sp. PvR098]MBP2438531.1 TM2 domain-containing membrane protein YozV [Paenibacillus sp. PvP052]
MQDQDQSKGPNIHDDDQEDAFLRERMERYGQARRQQPYDPFYDHRMPRKNKWIAGILSLVIPGTGQLYLGLMQRGMSIMLLLIVDIFAIVFFATNGATSIPLIVLFSLLVPVIYFYNIFDALQQTDKVNYSGSSYEVDGRAEEWMTFPGEEPVKRKLRGNGFGYVLIAAGALLFLVNGKPAWLDRVFDFLGSSIGAVILIAVGVYMFFKESMKK